MTTQSKPRILITLGDVAGIGPEIVDKAWEKISEMCEPVVIGHPRFLKTKQVINPSKADLNSVKLGFTSAEAGQAAYDWLCYAIDECMAKRADAIVTCPLHKEGLHRAGVPFPGHTEILATRTKSTASAMLLYDDTLKLAVAHVTLHQSVALAVHALSLENILDKIRLLETMIPFLTGQKARIGVLALNPHAGDGGLFGDEEQRLIRPAIEQAQKIGMDVIGPIATDAAFLPSNRSRVNGYVALLHDHGHIPMKLLGGRRAINVTAGIPIIRTSVAHGTAYDIVGKGIADESSLIEAVRVAARMVEWNFSIDE
jgi:4-hydroxythreonine-4-phosphate dehydrogenase